MKKTPFRATGEAMPIADATIECSADLASLIAVCTFTAGRISSGDEDAADLSADLARCLAWCQSLSRQTHDDIVGVQRIARMRKEEAEARVYPQPLRA